MRAIAEDQQRSERAIRQVMADYQAQIRRSKHDHEEGDEVSRSTHGQNGMPCLWVSALCQHQAVLRWLVLSRILAVLQCQLSNQADTRSRVTTNEQRSLLVEGRLPPFRPQATGPGPISAAWNPTAVKPRYGTTTVTHEDKVKPFLPSQRRR